MLDDEINIHYPVNKKWWEARREGEREARRGKGGREGELEQ